MLLTRLLVAFVLLCLLVAVLTLYRAHQRERAAEAAFPPEGRMVEVAGLRVHAVVTGTGPDVVLIHGSSGNTRDLTFRLAGALADRYRVIVFDRPGLGYSDRLHGDDGIVAQASTLSAAAQALGAERPIVMGQSYGGAVALAWAVHFPDRLSALVPVSSPSQRWEGPLPLLYKVTSHPVGAALVVPLITAWVPDGYVRDQVESIFAPQSMPEGYAAHVGAPLTLRRVSMRANAAQRATLKDEITALRPRYGEIDVPVEIVHGTADTTVPFGIHAEPLRDQVPGARLTPLPGIGHVPQNVATEAVAAGIDRAHARVLADSDALR
ncbi:alpha/beta fold hydrolase [Roseisalinus antarcticus]|uniref:2-hydroxy-6-oxo-6-phenylhexa-2,4-dienoate hydrolase n=1 Tax=Roseisalinus antarcticus TaxID=254357 RepID=A0A1Y5RGZ6_9RHOB|nr:alpha/beta hydrolase [Roseisalinus antarcticus]SLN16069.1 2-hydroxy-6-oxo-6-phenylhexa-2,4-dienoate hydrolase [Roseisalinus antarcticus]